MGFLDAIEACVHRGKLLITGMNPLPCKGFHATSDVINVNVSCRGSSNATVRDRLFYPWPKLLNLLKSDSGELRLEWFGGPVESKVCWEFRPIESILEHCSELFWDRGPIPGSKSGVFR